MKKEIPKNVKVKAPKLQTETKKSKGITWTRNLPPGVRKGGK